MIFKTLYNDDFNNAAIRSFQKRILSTCGVDIAETDLKKIYRTALRRNWSCEEFFEALDELIKKRRAN